MFVAIVWIICAIVAGMIGKSKGRTGLGWTLGIFLSLVGVIIIALMPANAAMVESKAVESGESRKCPYCAELIKREARICKHCGKELMAT